MIPKETYQTSLAANRDRFIGQFRKLAKSLKTTQEFHAFAAQTIPGGDTFDDYLAWSDTMLKGVLPMLDGLKKQIDLAEEEFRAIQKAVADQAYGAVTEYGSGTKPE